ncbi:MAG: hypothetical protein K2M07_07765 [Muribaculaceae bacterium]|nr:hypothetical protein [Muribaculaceae bacterium]
MITELTAEQYSELDVNPAHCYNTVAFAELNSSKVERVHYLAWFIDGKLRVTLILGEDEATLRSPFSAPFGGFDCVRHPSDEDVEMIFNDLRNYAADLNKTLSITLPPLFYSNELSSFLIRAVNTPWINVTADYNYHYNTAIPPDFNLPTFKEIRKKLRRANSAGFQFQLVIEEHKKREVYEVIRRNRESQGYPLSMTFGQIMSTEAIVRMDFFMMYDEARHPVASAICYHVAPGIVQVIYWGDLVDYRPLYPMNLFAMRVFAHYHEAGIKIVDVGPSSTGGIPNRGLCTFKHRIGCELTSKYTLTIG